MGRQCGGIGDVVRPERKALPLNLALLLMCCVAFASQFSRP